MMSLESSAVLFGVMFLLAVAPGPALFALIARALALGWLRAVPFLAGMLIADAVFLLLAAFGMGALATHFGPVFGAIKMLGGLYLIWLAVSVWRSAGEGAAAESALDVTAIPLTNIGKTFASGLALNLGNPKVILFYGAVLPTVMDMAALDGWSLTTAVLVTFAAVICGVAPYLIAASRLRGVMRSVTARRRMDRTAAVVMGGTGVAVIA